MTHLDRPPPPALITPGAVLVPGHLAGPLWRLLRTELDRHRSNGGQVPPDVAQLVDALRAGHLAHLTANGHTGRTSGDIGASSAEQALITTDQLAARLGVTPRQARRIAKAGLVEPVARGLWRTEDAAELAARRRR